MADSIGPYADSMEHLSDELQRLDILLELEALNMNAAPQSDAPFNEIPGLFVSASEAKSFLYEDDSELSYTFAQEDRLKQMESRLEARLRLTEQQYITLPLVALQERFQLNELELRCMLVALAPHVSRRYDKLFSYLQEDYISPNITIDLMLRVCGRNADERRDILHVLVGGNSSSGNFFVAATPASHTQTPSLLTRTVRLHERIVYYLLELEWRYEGPLARMQLHPSGPDNGLAPLLLNDALQEYVNKYAMRVKDHASATVWMVHGPSGSGKTYLARRTGHALGRALLEWDVRDAPQEEQAFVVAVDRMLMEARLQDAIPVFDHLHILQHPLTEVSSKDRRLERLMERLGTWQGLIFLLSEEEIKPVVSSASLVGIPISLTIPDIGERQRLWQSLTEHSMRLSSAGAGILAGKFLFTPGKISATIDEVHKSAGWREISAGDEGEQQSALELLHRSAYHLISHRLKEKAVKLEPKYGWDDLILPQDTLHLLRQACSRVQHRNTVLNNCGFDRKLLYGKGISMMFTGPPGTGKTMSALVMAKEMSAELYRVDLSRVVSKYIGETEKNLSEIFDQARLSGAILFFDEADALFGKRSEVKDAHDKYANMETSYLLQKMEEYDGITILATNFAQNLDDAFTRRIQFIIKYPFPDAVQREQLWRATFPKELPVEQIDYAFLSQAFELAGGPIKNIVVTAAFLAVSEAVPVSMKQIIEGVIQEYKKTGKVLLKDRLGAYAEYWKG